MKRLLELACVLIMVSSASATRLSWSVDALTLTLGEADTVQLVADDDNLYEHEYKWVGADAASPSIATITNIVALPAAGPDAVIKDPSQSTYYGWWTVEVRDLTPPSNISSGPQWEVEISAGSVTGIHNLYSDVWGDNDILEITVVPEPPPIEAVIDIVPHTFNLATEGKWITSRIWLPEDYNVADINPNSVQLQSEPNDIYVEWIWFKEKQNVVMARFSRSEVQEMVEPGEVELTIAGRLVDGTYFKGTDTIRVIDKGRSHKGRVNSNSKIEDGIEYYIQTDKSVYKLEEDVKMLYKVTNLRDEDVTFTFGGSPEWNFWVEKDGEVIWRAVEGWWADGTAFTLAPSEYKEFRYVWDMKDHKGNLVIDVGEYNVLGRLDGGSSANSDDYYSFTSVAVGIETVP